MSLKRLFNMKAKYMERGELMDIKEPNELKSRIYHDFAENTEPKITLTGTTADKKGEEIKKQIPYEEWVMLSDFIAWALERRAKDQEVEIKKIEELYEHTEKSKNLWHSWLKLASNQSVHLFNCYSALFKPGYGHLEYQMADNGRIESLTLETVQALGEPLTATNTTTKLYTITISRETARCTIYLPMEYHGNYTFSSDWKKMKNGYINRINFEALLIPQARVIRNVDDESIIGDDVNRIKTALLNWSSNFLYDENIESPIEDDEGNRIPVHENGHLEISIQVRYNSRAVNEKVHRFTYFNQNSPYHKRKFDMVMPFIPQNELDDRTREQYKNYLRSEAAKFTDIDKNMIRKLTNINLTKIGSTNLFSAESEANENNPGQFKSEILDLYKYTFTSSYYTNPITVISHPDLEIIKSKLLYHYGKSTFHLKGSGFWWSVVIPQLISSNLATDIVNLIKSHFEFDISNKNVDATAKCLFSNEENPDSTDSNNIIRTFNRAADVAGLPTTLSKGALAYIKAKKTVDKDGDIS